MATTRWRSGAWLAALAIAMATPSALAQEDDELIQPPRIDEGPGEARLAPAAEIRAPVMEEVIVVNESEWRLPDLGSAWRQRQEDAAPTGRIEARFLPLYDPENADPNVDLFPRNREMRRVGFIEVFRVRFGRRERE